MVDVKFPTVTSCLYCISLRSGVKFLGWMFLAGHIAAIFSSPLRNLTTYLECSLIPLYDDPDTGSHVCPDWLELELLITVIADFSLSVVQILTAFLLLLGVYQTKPLLILQWVVLQILMLIFDIVLMEMSYLRQDIRFDMKYFYGFYITWKSLEVCGIYFCYCYYRSVISDPTQVV